MAFTRSFENFKPPRRFDSVPFETVEVRESATENGTYATIETIALSPVDTDPATPASRNFTTDEAVEAVGWYVIRWVDGGGAFSDSVPVRFGATGANDFASVEDVATRLGRVLTGTEEDTVGLLLGLASAAIRAAIDKPESWMPDPVPQLLRGFCVEVTCRGFLNTGGLFSKSETIGSYSYTNSFNRELPSGIALTDAETLVLRRSVWGTNAGSARAENVLDDLCAELDEHEGS